MSLSQTKEQLLAYARDLSDAYQIQRQLAQYLPRDLMEKLRKREERFIAEKRYVTILFADIVGFTRLFSYLEAEDIFALVNTTFEQLSQCIYKYGGVIDKYIGDGLMAVFGAYRSHEDDPVRALHSAMEMQQAMESIREENRLRLNQTLELRIGIHSGLVIAGTVGSPEQLSYTVIGDPVNLASRLQTAADPGSILVSEEVHSQGNDRFDFKLLKLTDVKGFNKPLSAYKLLGLRSEEGEEPSLAAKPVALVDREAELIQLKEIGNLWQSGENHLVILSGEAGIGKSRLIQEWLHTDSAFHEANIFQLSGLNFQKSLSFSLWNMLTAEVGLPANQPVSNSKKHSNNLPDYYSTADFLNEAYKKSGENSRLALFIDNWQWIDESSKNMLMHLLQQEMQQPTLICFLTRNSALLDLSSHQSVKQFPQKTQVSLKPLRDAQCVELLHNLTGDLPLSQKSLKQILMRCGGNPYYITELMQLIKERVSHEFPWAVPTPEAVDAVALRGIPRSINGLIRAKVDQLPEELRETLIHAAIIGTSFSIELLQAVMNRAGKVWGIPKILFQLRRAGYIEHIRGKESYFTFSNVIVQETLYDSLLSERKKSIHRLIGEELEVMPLASEQDYYELLAYHFAQADVTTKAINYYIRAGQHAQLIGAKKKAVDHYIAALMMMNIDKHYEHDQIGLEMTLASLYEQMEETDEAVIRYEHALKASSNPTQKAELSRRLSQLHYRCNDIRLAKLWLDRSLNYLSQSRLNANALLRARVYFMAGVLESQAGDNDQGLFWLNEAKSIFEINHAGKDITTCQQIINSLTNSASTQILPSAT